MKSQSTSEKGTFQGENHYGTGLCSVRQRDLRNTRRPRKPRLRRTLCDPSAAGDGRQQQDRHEEAREHRGRQGRVQLQRPASDDHRHRHGQQGLRRIPESLWHDRRHQGRCQGCRCKIHAASPAAGQVTGRRLRSHPAGHRRVRPDDGSGRGSGQGDPRLRIDGLVRLPRHGVQHRVRLSACSGRCLCRPCLWRQHLPRRCHRPEHDPFFPAQRMVGGNGRQHPGLAPALLQRQAGRLSGPCHPGHHRRLADVSD